ncbi:hypothetical protein OUZ56_001245 [Daphnia magna]|uniref:Uncharacterized protein n=1 Tax=Daphnia magna TaxID=35525 RepID=A0ABR0A227_9CRUS|nr:hypothetical protein OUZ56_001245 [Daphnia magna]
MKAKDKMDYPTFGIPWSVFNQYHIRGYADDSGSVCGSSTTSSPPLSPMSPSPSLASSNDSDNALLLSLEEPAQKKTNKSEYIGASDAVAVKTNGCNQFPLQGRARCENVFDEAEKQE